MTMQNHEDKIHILFICHGNICRSPMAEMIMKDMVRQRGLDEKYEISSMPPPLRKWAMISIPLPEGPLPPTIFPLRKEGRLS